MPPPVSYIRDPSSPRVLGVSPSGGLPGTLLTITGENFNVTAPGSAPGSDPSGGVGVTNVTVGGAQCGLVSSSDTEVVCALPSAVAGVYPLLVWTPFGLAGPAKSPLVTVALRADTLGPAIGSVGGGQILTIAGANFPPLDKLDLTVTVNTSFPNASGPALKRLPCAVATATGDQITCTTPPVPDAPGLARYLEGTGRYDTSTVGATYGATVEVGAFLQGLGDELRVVATYEYVNFNDNQRPGIFVVGGATGLEYHVDRSDFIGYGSPEVRAVAMYYDPATREVVSYCARTGGGINAGSIPCSYKYNVPGLPEPTNMQDFLLDGPPEYLLVFQTHHWY